MVWKMIRFRYLERMAAVPGGRNHFNYKGRNGMMKRRVLSLFMVMVIVVGMAVTGNVTGIATINAADLSSRAEEPMLEAPLEDIDTAIRGLIDDGMMAGHTVLVARNGNLVKQGAYGHAAMYVDDDFTEMEHPVDMQTDTIFDMASISKLFTAVAVMQLWDEGH